MSRLAMRLQDSPLQDEMARQLRALGRTWAPRTAGAHAKPRQARAARAAGELLRLAAAGWDAAADYCKRAAARTAWRLQIIFTISWPSRRRAAWWLPIVLFVISLNLIIIAAIYQWLNNRWDTSLLTASSVLTIGLIAVLEGKAASREKACRQGAPLRLVADDSPMVPAVLVEQVQANSAAIAELLRSRDMYAEAFRQMCEIAGIDPGDPGPGRTHRRLRVIPGGPAA